MATYFHGNNDNNNTSEIQSSAEGLQTLYLMNPNYVPFSGAAQNPTPSMLLLNPSNNTSTSNSTSATHHGHALNLGSLSHAPPQQHHHLVGVTIPASNIIGGANAHEIPSFHGFAMAAGAPRYHYNLWGSTVDQIPSSVAAAAVTTVAAASPSNSGHVVTVAGAAATDIGFHRPSHQQGLSLSLSSQQPSYRSFSGEMDAVSPASHGGGCGDVRVVGNNNGVSSMHSVVLGSKYLKAAQELLDEVVNVGNKGISIIEGASNSNKEKMKGNIVESTSGVGDGSSGGGESSGAANKQGGELSTAQRQELQMKKSKLVNMLDEVEQRYRQYHHQMQVVISSFEQAAGFGAARSYTALALKTISKQFRSLKDAISSQIRATSKTLGEDDCLGAKLEGSRLRFVDHHLRQQRALQQLGMIQHNAWRPQRGLPERAVSILRAWLFEHFLHPYPKDSDKVMLAKQTGLTRSQVSNWFINARVRLWKPMVEEMYLEEVKDQDQNNGSSSQDNTNRSKESNNELWSTSNTAQEQAAIRLDQINVLQSKAESFNNNNNNSHQNTSPTDQISNSNNNSMSTSPMGGGHPGNFLLAAGSSDMQRSPNKPRSSEIHNSQSSILSMDMDMDMEMKPNGETHREANNNTKFGIERNHGGGGYGAFSMEEIGRFNNHITDHHHQQHQLAPRFHGNAVSLTLGLPPSENLPLPATQHGFLSQNMDLGGRLEINGNNENEFCAMNSTPPSSHSGASYDDIDMQNRKRFAAQLLRDFVA